MRIRHGLFHGEQVPEGHPIVRSILAHHGGGIVLDIAIPHPDVVDPAAASEIDPNPMRMRLIHLRDPALAARVFARTDPGAAGEPLRRAGRVRRAIVGVVAAKYAIGVRRHKTTAAQGNAAPFRFCPKARQVGHQTGCGFREHLQGVQLHLVGCPGPVRLKNTNA